MARLTPAAYLDIEEQARLTQTKISQSRHFHEQGMEEEERLWLGQAASAALLLAQLLLKAKDRLD